MIKLFVITTIFRLLKRSASLPANGVKMRNGTTKTIVASEVTLVVMEVISGSVEAVSANCALRSAIRKKMISSLKMLSFSAPRNCVAFSHPKDRLNFND